MTTASHSAAGGEGRRLVHLGILLGHIERRWGGLTLAVVWVLVAVGWWVPDKSPAGQALYWITFLTMLVMLGMAVCEWRVHDRQPCLRCVEETPLLDPEKAIRDNERYLRTFHNQRFRRNAGVVAMTPIVVMLALAGHENLTTWMKIAMTVFAGVGILTGSYIGQIKGIHRRLYPWCPWCRRDDGGGDEVATPTPDPAGTARR